MCGTFEIHEPYEQGLLRGIEPSVETLYRVLRYVHELKIVLWVAGFEDLQIHLIPRDDKGCDGNSVLERSDDLFGVRVDVGKGYFEIESALKLSLNSDHEIIIVQVRMVRRDWVVCPSENSLSGCQYLIVGDVGNGRVGVHPDCHAGDVVHNDLREIHGMRDPDSRIHLEPNVSEACYLEIKVHKKGVLGYILQCSNSQSDPGRYKRELPLKIDRESTH